MSYRHINRSVEPTLEQILKADNDEWIRAGGDCICPICEKEYKRHTEIEFSENFHLTELCDGTLVKL